jgi:ribosomal protein RSM22 (predicted rRNA methylase)
VHGGRQLRIKCAMHPQVPAQFCQLVRSCSHVLDCPAHQRGHVMTQICRFNNRARSAIAKYLASAKHCEHKNTSSSP